LLVPLTAPQLLTIKTESSFFFFEIFTHCQWQMVSNPKTWDIKPLVLPLVQLLLTKQKYFIFL
jgi:hypothetical protein